MSAARFSIGRRPLFGRCRPRQQGDLASEIVMEKRRAILTNARPAIVLVLLGALSSTRMRRIRKGFGDRRFGRAGEPGCRASAGLADPLVSGEQEVPDQMPHARRQG